jgi:DNA-binding XRE family transcriptional regulator
MGLRCASQTAEVDPDIDVALAAIAARVRSLRRDRSLTLAELAAKTGISESTLSRLESGQRRPNLELLLPVGPCAARLARRDRRAAGDR